jgi:hypothetical protein
MTSSASIPIPNSINNSSTKKVELLSDNIKLGKDTILTEKYFSKGNTLDNYIHLDIFTGSFFTGIILIIICIVYLFKSNTEYLSWIFGLVLLVVLPLTWITNFIKSGNSIYKLYIAFCLFLGIILNFTAVLMVILYTTRLNNRIKEYKANQVLEPGQTSGKFHINQIITDNYQKIKILFTTNLVLSIGIILNFFVYEGEKFNNKKTNIETNMSTNIYWWYSIIENKLLYIDEYITHFVHYIPINGLLKMFLLFCAGFLFFFFSFFVKLKTTFVDDKFSDPYIQNLISEFGYGLNGIYPATNYDIVNFPNILVETAGPVNFAALSSFFLSFIVIIIFYFLYLLLKQILSNIEFLKFIMPLFTFIDNKTQSPPIFVVLICLFFVINFLALYFGNLSSSPKVGGNPNITSSNIISQNYILLLLCFVFSLLGTPVVFMVFELISRIFSVSLASDLIEKFIIKTCNFPNCNYRAFFALILLFVSFFGLLFGIFFYGANLDGQKNGHWLSNDGNNKEAKLFIVLILSLMVGWFFALHLKFNMFSFVYQCFVQPSRMILFIIAPLTLLALSITQIAIADLSSKIVGNPVMTDG